MAIQLPSLNTTEKTSTIVSNFFGSGLAVVQGVATVIQLGIAKKTQAVEQYKAANVVATLGTESTRNTAQAAYFTTGASILEDVRQSNRGLIAVRNQLLMKLTTCNDPAEKAEIMKTINSFNESLSANNSVVGATLNGGSAAQQIQ